MLQPEPAVHAPRGETTMIAHRPAARIPKRFTKLSRISSTYRPVVVGISNSEIRAIGTITRMVDARRDVAGTYPEYQR